MKFQLIAVCIILAVFSIEDVVCNSQYEEEAEKAQAEFQKCLAGLLDTANSVATNMFGTPESRACGARISQQAALLAGNVATGVKTCKTNSDEDEKFQCITSTCKSGKATCSSLLIDLLGC